MTRRRIALVVLFVASLSIACGGKKGNPNEPSPTPTAVITRIMELLGGPLNIGDVTLGQSRTADFSIRNAGTGALTITGLSGPCGSQFATSYTGGTIQPNTQQSVTIQFTPSSVNNCNGTIVVSGNQTSGGNTIGVNASGTLNGIPNFQRSGTGDTVFDIPAHVTRIRIQGGFGGNSSNFIVKIAGRLIVNELMGTAWGQTSFDGTYLITAGGTVQITSSSGVTWIFTEQR